MRLPLGDGHSGPPTLVDALRFYHSLVAGPNTAQRLSCVAAKRHLVPYVTYVYRYWNDYISYEKADICLLFNFIKSLYGISNLESWRGGGGWESNSIV